MLIWLIKIGLLIAIALWAFSNIWMLLAIFAVIMTVLIIYGMSTSDNEWVSSLTNLAITSVIGGALYLMFS